MGQTLRSTPACAQCSRRALCDTRCARMSCSSPVEIGRQGSASWIDGAQRMSELSSSGGVLHLHYRQIVSSPLDAVRAVYRHSGLALTEEAEGRMRSWLRTSVNVRRPWRDYKLAEFGLDVRLLRERFARYTDTFGIEIEHGERAAAATGALA
jgi:hypothetical protein